MSLSDGGNYAQNWFANDGGDGQQVTQLIGQLTAMNIPVIAATGNSFTGQQGEGFAAIVAGTISVTATDLSGNLLSNAQRLGSAIGGASATTIAAPGEGLTAPSGDSGTATVEGTSFATALVTGGVTLLQEIYQSRFGTLPTVAQIKSWLQRGATPVNDPVTGITLGELNILKSGEPDPHAEPAPPHRPHPRHDIRHVASATADADDPSTPRPRRRRPRSTTRPLRRPRHACDDNVSSTTSTAASTATSRSTSTVSRSVRGNSTSTTSLDEAAFEAASRGDERLAGRQPVGSSVIGGRQVQIWNA